MARNMSANKRAGSVRWLYEAQEGLCAICSGPMPEPDCPNEGRAAMLPHSPTVDHIKPKVRGGNDRLENLLLVHKVCNEAKGRGDLPISAKKIRMRVWGKIQTLRAEEKASIEAAKVKQAEFKDAVEQAKLARLVREENDLRISRLNAVTKQLPSAMAEYFKGIVN